jgi:TonB family protein
MVATQLGRYALLFALAICVPGISEGSQGNTVVPVLVHRKTGSKPCELVQRGSLVIAKEFAWVEIQGEESETYSPELGPGDFLSPSLPVSGHVAKDARKSGFELREESRTATDPPKVLPLVSDADCTDLQGAISEVAQARASRRTALQARAYKPGTDDVVAASPVSENKSASTSDQSTVPNNPPDVTAAKTKNKFHGTVGLIILIGTDGTVQQSKIVRSLNPELDKKAADEVSRWKFSPARKKGLPVPSVVPVELTFNLH